MYCCHVPNLVADNGVMHRLLAICMTTNKTSTILLSNEDESDSGLPCVHFAGPHLQQ